MSEHEDGTERLCRALYGRPAEPRDFVGGAAAIMLHDAADRLFQANKDVWGALRLITEAGDRLMSLQTALQKPRTATETRP